MSKNSRFKQFNIVSRNLKRIISLFWKEDRFVFIGFYLSTALNSLLPLLSGFVYKLFIDKLIEYQKIDASIPFIFLSLLGMYYIIDLSRDFIGWGLRGTYFDFLFRTRLQNLVNYEFNKKLTSVDIEHLENTETQNLIEKTKDTATWRIPSFMRSFSDLFGNCVGFISALLILLIYNPIAPIFIILSTIPRFLLRTRYGKTQWSIYSDSVPESRKLWYLSNILYNKVAVIESRIFQNNLDLLQRFKNLQTELYEKYKKPARDFLKLIAYPWVIEYAVVGLFAYLKIPEVVAGHMSVGDFAFFVTLLSRLSGSAMDIAFNFGDMYENNLYADNFFEFLDLKRIITEVPDPVKIPNTGKPPKIEFNNVSFKYPGTDKYVLKDLNFVIEPGKNVAIVGRNGAGKTTVIKLLCRFYDTTSGEILVNGINIKEVSLKDWYGFLGTLFQEFMQYDFTVAENIMLGDTTIRDKEKLYEAARKSGANEFIETFPNKYDQQLGRRFEKGMELSKGQWQKIAIARAFYEAAPVLILDEPTSAIDAESEYEIFNNLNKFYKDKTLVFISHRFSTVRNADKILVLDDGKVIEEGKHDELLKKSGQYSRMFKKQAVGYQ